MTSKVLIPLACVVGPLFGYCLGLCVPQRNHVPTIKIPADSKTDTSPAPAPAPPAPTVQDEIRPLEELMPKWEIRSNAPAQYQIAFQEHDKTNWTLVTNIFSTAEQAQGVISEVKLDLAVKYVSLKAVHDAFSKGKQR